MRCRYSTVKFSIRDWRSTMCREGLIGQNAEAEDGRGEEDGDDEEGGGTALPAAASASPPSELLWGPCMVAWLASLENPLLREKSGFTVGSSFIFYKNSLFYQTQIQFFTIAKTQNPVL